MLVDTPSPLPHFSFETPPRAATPFGRDLRLAGLAQTMPLIVCDAPKAQSGRITTLKPACSFGTLQTPHCGSAPAGESVTHKKMLRIGGTNSTSLFKISKTSKKTNSKRTHLEARNCASASRNRSIGPAGADVVLQCLRCAESAVRSDRAFAPAWPFGTSQTRRPSGLRQPRRYGNRRNKARMFMKTKDR